MRIEIVLSRSASCLLSGSVSLGAPARYSSTPFKTTIEQRWQRFSSRNADVNAQEDDGATALAWAAVRCNIEIAKLLLKAGANPNLTNEQGIGPLVSGDHEWLARRWCELLLGNGADPNVAREDGETPLMTATRLGQIDVMKMLLDHGAQRECARKEIRPDRVDVGRRPP